MTTTGRLALRMAEVADSLGVHRATVQRWVATGQLTSVRIGGTVRVRPEDVEQFVNSHLEGNSITAQRLARSRRTA